MPLERFEKLRRYLHFVDNFTYDNEVQDKLFKIRPVVDSLRNQCILVKPEEVHAVNEQIIPSKTKFSKIRQYNPKKPIKWGFKILVRAGSSGLIYDFYIYGGKDTTNPEEVDYAHLQKSAQVVAKLCKDLPCHKEHKVLFDNWFTTLDLLLYMKKRGTLACGTVGSNRLQGCLLQTNNELKKMGRGSLDYKSDANSGVIVAKWCDNNAVHAASNFVGIEPQGSVQRWSSEAKEKIDVPCPRIIQVYNSGIGGVDLADMLIALYRIVVKTERWYVKIFWHCVDIAKVNAWLLYRRQSDDLGASAKKQLSLLQFSIKVADALMFSDKTPNSESRRGRVGRPSKRSLSEKPAKVTKRGRKPFVPQPAASARFDGYGHWPEVRSQQKGRCRNCPQGVSRVYCLCLTGEKNLFSRIPCCLTFFYDIF